MNIRGAEATIEIKDEGVIKTREPKEYRHEELDKRIRTERTSEELKNIERARKYGAQIPETEKEDEKTLKQEKIEGKQLKKVLKDNIGLMEFLGRNVSKMHSADVIHGDLTTSNAVYSEEGELYVIDLGLSQVSDRVEDKAVDLHLLKQVLESSHPNISERAWKKFLAGYKNYENSEEVLERLEEVESRGRYK